MTTKHIWTRMPGTAGHNRHDYDDALSPIPGDVWLGCPLAAVRGNPEVGHEFFDHFHDFRAAADAWVVNTQASGGAALDPAAAGGVVTLDSGSTTANAGVQIQRAGAAFVPASTKHLWYEARVKQNQPASQIFVGLAVIDPSLIAAGAIAHTDSLGFWGVTGDGVLLAATRRAGTHTTTQVHTMTADEWVRLGFVFEGVARVVFLVNGVTTVVHTTNIPEGAFLSPSFLCQEQGGGQPVLRVDYCRVVQLL